MSAAVESRPPSGSHTPVHGPLPIRRRLGLLLRLALRNTLRQSRRSLLTASAMVLGLALLMISRAIADGAHEQWIEDGVRLAQGHVAIQAPGYRSSGSLTDRLDSTRLASAEAALRLPAVARYLRGVSPRVTVSGLASSPGSAVPVRIEGVEPDSEAVFSNLGRHLAEGRYLEAGDRLAAFIGVGLARRLGLHVGSRMVLTAQSAGGQIEGQLVRIVGIFRTGIPEMDDGLIHIPLRTARSWLGVPGGVTTLAVLLGSSDQVSDVVEALRATLDPRGAAAGGIRVLPWTEASPELESAVRIDDYGDYVFHLILFVIVALAVLNAVLMSVLNRRREFGVLQALGLTRRETGAVVFTEGLLLTALSGILGIILGFGVTWLFWRHGMDLSALYDTQFTVSGSIVNPVIVPLFRLAQVLQSVAFIVVIGIIASLYPAYQAARIDVAEAMKFEH